MGLSLNPIADIITAVGGIAENLITTDKEKLAFALEEDKLNVGLQQGQLDVNKAEAANASLFVAGWRPAIGWIGGAALAYQFLVYPFMVWIWSFLQAQGIIALALAAPPMLSTDSLWVLLSGMLGIAGARTVEKIKGVAS